MSLCIFPNLAAEIARKKMTQGSLATHVGVTQTTLGLKLQGKAPITLSECRKIRNAIDETGKISLDYLFEMADGLKEDSSAVSLDTQEAELMQR